MLGYSGLQFWWSGLSRKITIDIKGYGVVKVKRPKKLTRQAYSDGVAEAVAKTMQVVAPVQPPWHPVMGYKK
jgi:hypothetical protein